MLGLFSLLLPLPELINSQLIPLKANNQLPVTDLLKVKGFNLGVIVLSKIFIVSIVYLIVKFQLNNHYYNSNLINFYRGLENALRVKQLDESLDLQLLISQVTPSLFCKEKKNEDDGKNLLDTVKSLKEVIVSK